MINIPLPFLAMWGIMFAGVLTNVLARINGINQKSPDDVLWWVILQKFFKKEWASYGSSLIFTGIIAFSFQYIKQFDNSSNAEISKYAKWIPLAVPAFYFFGVLNQWLFYKALGRIQGKSGAVDIDILKENSKP
jgi:hypothetical protein